MDFPVSDALSSAIDVKQPFRSRLNLVGAVLIFLALAGVVWADREQSIRLGIAIAMVGAALKAVLILYHYMDVRSAPAPARAFLVLWATCCAVMIIVLH